MKALSVIKQLIKRKYLLSILFGIIVILCLYKIIWYIRYPTLDWKTYTNKDLGISLQYPPSFRVIVDKSQDYDIRVFFSDDEIKNPSRGWAKENIAFEYDDHTTTIGGGGVLIILKGFFLEISKRKAMSKYMNYSIDTYIKSFHYKDGRVAIGGETGYKSSLLEWFPGAWVIGRATWVKVYKGVDEISFTVSYPINQHMYSRLFDRILSTVKFDN